MSLKWYIGRLAAMSPAEIAHRVGEVAKKSLSRRRSYDWTSFPVTAGPAPVIPGLRDAFLENSSPDLTEAVRAASRALLAGRFSALGVAWPERSSSQLFPAEVWRLDPVTGGVWPGAERFCFDIPYRHERTLGDIKYVWEFNRLQHLQPLAALVALEGDRAALAAIEAAVASWHAANPPFRGLGWNSGIELALRAVSLLIVASLCGDALSPATAERIRVMLAAHLHWLRRYPSRFSSANNHLVAEAMAEFLIALAMPELGEARRAESEARATLEREAASQILDDGVPAEQSPTYGAFTAEMLMLASAAGRAAGRPLGAIVETRLAAFARFVGTLATPGGAVPAIGDDDEGRVLTLTHPPETAYPASVAAAIAGHLRQAPFGPVAPDPELRDAVFAAPRAGTIRPLGLETFPTGGLTVVREARCGRDLTLVIDHGPLGYLTIAAHGHADANSIMLTLDGEPVIVDPGTYLYHSGGPWRDWFRGTAAHSTLTLAGLDQSTISGPFNWSHKAKARVEHVQSGDNWSVTASHDGYRRRLGTDHVRTVAATPTGLKVVDRLDPAPAEPLAADLVFQFAPGIDLILADGAWRASRNGLPLVALTFESHGTVTASTGESNVSGGWVSPAFGLKVPATRLTWRGSMGPRGIATGITIEPRR
ncbi:heparinase [Methylobacterium sp. Leaf104]|uniref:heparinase II/III family protein n=1 Tax=Methylobacterium TaxID=407 RepID=UPI0006FBE618|nr:MULTISPECIES: heparinase II/III family protein [Methylobacterium]KQP38297.1 heparinase [Methylobacterium sp. Leaf104]MCI9880311.1 alginate lyase family protein [Methylobacterium goesingense]